MENFSDRGIKKSVDWALVVTYLLLILIGWVNIYASIHSDGPASIFDYNFRSGKQFVWILTALGLAALILFVVNAQLWESASIPLYLGVLCLLVAVIFLGVEVKGSRSWFEFGPIRFQPAEVSKITTSLLLATLMSQVNFRITRFKDFLLTALILGIPMVVILAESETGSALVYVGFIFVMYREGFSGWWIFCIGMAALLFILTLTASPYVSILVLAGVLLLCNGLESNKIGVAFWIFSGVLLILCLLPWIFGKFSPESFVSKINPLYILVGICVAAVLYLMIVGYRSRHRFLSMSALGLIAGMALVFSTEFIFNNILQDHQRKRIEVLLGMKEDPAGVGYNVNQSMIAIGSGGLHGKGFLGGTQTTFGFVPEQSTDFIFCTVGEEWGFLGCLVVISLYVFLISRIIMDAEKSREAFTRIYGYCVASCIFMHLFINIGMTIGIMPVIGIPLPLLSYGGSSLWAFTVLIFIFIALYRQEKKYY
ncbi:MAG: rod shape-determining protein RodA [Alistipes sp.]|jgi:rod shape determining protein RodA|nr:rod shape-determining protein RodA [Alistipes sp.]MCI6439716.1 rod shape-determining protein RodA [Alistipes sp.]MDD7709954.1 rod shape-determining protein RodA [Alistipes sp.]MDY3834706.1 rod shape-determining protein RodA [Candidatus Cryptobacteroides sp.]CDD17128.1 rod shape-determining protein RodA [Alistipes sp. CAG:435]